MKGPGRRNQPTPKRRGVHRDLHRGREGRQAGVGDTRAPKELPESADLADWLDLLTEDFEPGEGGL